MPEAGAAQERYVVFSVGGARYAVRSAAVEEVLEDGRIAPLPGLPSHVAGVLRHRGGWTCVLDAATLIAGAARESSASGGARTARALLLLRRGGIRYALAVDGVEAVRNEARMEAFGTGAVLRVGDAVASILELDTFFAAEPPPSTEEITSSMERRAEPRQRLLTLRVGGLDCALEIGDVEEVLPHGEPEPVDAAPAFVRGVLRVRGERVPLLDLRQLLDVEATPPGPAARAVIARLAGRRVALLADDVSDVVELPESRLAQPPRYLQGLTRSDLSAVAQGPDGLWIVLRLSALLSPDQERALAAL